MSDPLQLDATAQLQMLEMRRLGALELLDLSIQRARAVAETVNAVVAADPEPARAAARHIDERRTAIARAGGDPAEELGLLGGLPMTVSDRLDVDGLPAACGSARGLARRCSDADAVGRVRAAGAVVWGKTNTPRDGAEWRTQNRLYGRTCNPWDLARSPGGASGGSAAAVASGVSALEIGSDLAGGLRVPASVCGVFAHRPTYGLVSQRGHIPPAPGALAEPDLNTLGPVARSARDLRLLLSVLAPAALPARARPAELVGLRVGLWLEAPSFALDPEAQEVLDRWALALADQGARVEPAPCPVAPARLLRAFDALVGAEAARGLTLAQHAGRRALRPLALAWRAVQRAPGAWPARLLASTGDHHAWMRADEARARLAARLAPAFERWDVLIAPAAPVCAFAHPARASMGRLKLSDGRRLTGAELARWSALATTLGLPATCVPAGFTAGGLPVGVQIIGPPGADSRTLAVAEACETEIGGFIAPPLAPAPSLPRG